VDSQGMSVSLLALREAKGFVQAATAVYEPSLGELPQRREAQSGRAILALQQQADAGTGHFLQNLAKISMAYEARVVLDLIPAIYDRPGRVTQVLGEEETEKAVMLGQPFTTDNAGRPVAAATGAPQAKLYDLTEGKYSVSVSVGKAYQTRMQEGQAEIGEILSARPELMPMLGATYFRFRDFPGHKEIADILQKMRDRQFPFLTDEAQGLTIEQAQAQMAAMKEQLQQLQQQLQAALKAIETDRAKQEATVAKAQIDAQAKLAITEMQQQTQIVLKTMEERFRALTEVLKGRQDMAKTEFEAAHEMSMAAMKPPDLTYRGQAESPLNTEE
jgi:hypothetical protein